MPTTTEQATLAEFLLARIAEDEAAAHRAVGRFWTNDDGSSGMDSLWIQQDWAEIGTEQNDHAQRWEPRRVLAECEAKRQIVEGCVAFDDEATSGAALGHRVLRALALPHADHPDYRDEWRP